MAEVSPRIAGPPFPTTTRDTWNRTMVMICRLLCLSLWSNGVPNSRALAFELTFEASKHENFFTSPVDLSWQKTGIYTIQFHGLNLLSQLA